MNGRLFVCESFFVFVRNSNFAGTRVLCLVDTKIYSFANLIKHVINDFSFPLKNQSFSIIFPF